jgi:DNA mismatch endonuclease (patch repair protein)
VFVDGCFWHKCPKHFVRPKTNKEFWYEKISGNVERDKNNNRKLKSLVVRLWEHEIEENLEKSVGKVLRAGRR